MTGFGWHDEYPKDIYDEARNWVRDNKAHLIDIMVPEEFRKLLKRDLRIEETLEIEPASVLSDKEDTFWYRPEYIKDAPHWPRYWNFVRNTNKKWPKKSFDDLQYSTTQIVNQLPNPNMEGDFECTGIVVGYVQSGKTGNYTGVIAKAIDAGYNMAIVFSGLHNNLRKQTQIRLDRELTGLNTEGPHVEQPPTGEYNRWNVLTEEYADFYDHFPVNILDGKQPLLIVMKKNCTVLERLLSWLESADEDLKGNRNVLIIDDEADHGSINLGSQDDPSKSEDGDYAFDEVEGDLDVSRTNELIRRIRDEFPKRAFVGYTATPFANFLINPKPSEDEAGLGDTLYPKDFIIALEKPEEYRGTENLFPETHEEGREKGKLCVIPPEHKEILDLIEEQPFEMHVHSGLPDSLIDAITDFILTGAVKIIRKVDEKHHTMLIHTSHLVEVQTDMYRRITNLWDSWKTRLVNPSLYGKRNDLYEKLEEKWNGDFHGIHEDTTETWGAVCKAIPELCQQICIMEINHTTDEELDYDEFRYRNGLKVIAIGGTKFSRGLTLKGLTVSYYTREAKTYDTLLQMARWFGYRRRYYDLVRIYTTSRLLDWYGWLAVVERQIRADISRYDELGRSPADLAVRIRTHSAMLVTSPLKMGKHIHYQVGFDGQFLQTLYFYFNKPDKLYHNLDLARNLIYQIESNQDEENDLLWKDVAGKTIYDFISSYETPSSIQTFDKKQILKYIENQIKEGELDKWSVVLVSRDRKPVTRLPDFAGKDIGLTERSREKYNMKIGALADPQYWCTDLTSQPPTDSELSRQEWMFNNRSVDNGQLQIYIMNHDSTEWTNNRKEKQAFFEDGQEKVNLVGLVVVFPRSETAEKANYVTQADIPYE